MFRYVIFDILYLLENFHFFVHDLLNLKLSFFLRYPPISFFFEARWAKTRFAESFRKKDSPDSHIISPARPWRCNKPSEFTGELWERRCKHKTQEYPMYSPAYCTRRPLGFGRARSRRWTNSMREREREIHIGSKDTRDEGKTDRDRNIYTWNVSGYGAVCKCYDPLLCSSSLFVAVLPPRLTRSTMAPMGPREFCLLAFSRWRSAAGEKIENFESFRKFVLDSRSRRICFFFEEKKWQDPSHASIHRTWIIGWQGRITSFVNGLNTRPRQLCWIIEDRYLLSLHNNASTWISSLTLTNCLIHARVFLSDRRIILTNFRKQGENWLSFAIFRSISNRTGTIFSTGKRS